VRLPIRVRLIISYLAIMVALVTGLTVFVPLRLAGALVAQTDRSLGHRAALLAGDYLREGDGEFIENANTAASGLVGSDSWAQLLGPDGRLAKSTGDGLSTTPAIGPELVSAVLGSESRVITAELGPGHQRFRLILRPLGQQGHRRVLVLATSLDLVDEVSHELVGLLALAGVIAVALAGVIGWWLARIALLPITRISTRSERIHVGHLDERVPVPAADDEVAHLARTLNAMFDRLRDGVAQRRRLIADASHELRTPLAIMRAELDVALALPDMPEAAGTALERNVSEVDRMSRIVGNLLTLATIDRGELELLRRRIDLREEAVTVVRRFAELATAKGLSLRVFGTPAPIDADRERIGQVLSNLIDNAVKYTAVGAVDVHVWRGDAEAGVTVADTGPGIAADEADRVFDRFYRTDGARTRSAGGSGLGLAISKEIIRVHGGRIWVERDVGEGSRFSFVLPA
jgi:heavy metal sensor kinase